MVTSASLEVLLDHTQDKIILLDPDGEIQYVNEGARRILGFDPDDLVGEDAFSYLHPDDVERTRAAFEQAIESEGYTETSVEYRHRADDGSWVWLEGRMSNVTDDSLDGYVVSSRCISDRIEAQRESRETAARLRELSSTTGEVLWMFDSDWSELLFVNPAYEAVFGGSIEEVESDPAAFLDQIHPADLPAVEEAMERISAGESVEMEYRVNPEKDYNVWLWVQGEPIVEDGEVVRVTGFCRDITDRHRRERQLYVMDNILRHNLRNSLGIILGNAQLIEEDIPDAADRTAVIRQTGEELLASAEKEREIIEVITEQTMPRRLDVSSLVAESVETIRSRFPRAQIEYEGVDEAHASVIDEFGLAVLELLENTVTHSLRDEPTARVTLEQDDETVTLCIEDDAPEIPEVESRVLRGDHEMDEVYHSSGLGLWLVYWVVTLSNGSITVETLGEETRNRVQVTVPRALRDD
ncbi:PAS domain-containing protein [Haloarchaeobius amylolyticus]|uniref:PAS domain-containing protein n=1 Tax=Haloarchaeobius amylolyticus TaxID=1198296 RepID=UPI002270892D|nr:PAS domain-containing sensor histidine kinase [Haloarchaeobius amylolyticus]